MKTIEFSSKVKNGVIKIPGNGATLENNDVKVTIMWEEEKEKNYDSKKILSLLSEIRKRNVFDKIRNPKNWQKSLRNEWK